MKKITPKSAKRIAAFVLVGWLLGKCTGCVLLVPGPWGPKVQGELPSGGRLVFESRTVGRETDDRLTWVKAQGEKQSFWVDQIHAGFAHVILKMREDGSGVWVESDGKVGASLDLVSGEFRAERDPQFEWAQYGKGIKLAEGRTWGFLQLIYPL